MKKTDKTKQDGLLFSEAEKEKIILMSVAARPQTEEQMKKVWDWAYEARSQELMLQCVLAGHVSPFVREDGEICFKKIASRHPVEEIA